MATATRTRTSPNKVSFTPHKRDDSFQVVASAEGLGYNQPQIMGRKLWLPMFVMAIMGWSIGFVLAIVEAGTDRAEVSDLQTLGHLVPAFMFVGFLGVFSSISFAIARILGAFRKGGGEVQTMAGAEVQTIKMPATAKIMLAFMMMGMMVMLAGIIANFIAAGFGVDPGDLLDSAQWGAAASGLRRAGVALYLFGITFGLGTIIEVLRFQSVRIREVAAEHGHTH